MSPKILILCFPFVPGLLGLALVLLSAATEVNDGQLETLEEAGQALQRQDGLAFGRQERSAEPGKKGKKKKSKNGAGKMKKHCQRHYGPRRRLLYPVIWFGLVDFVW